MAELRKSHTKEECITIAKKYNTRSEFHKSKDAKIYLYACIHGWLDEVCFHMERKTGLEKRLIYAYEFCLNGLYYVYVGLTYNLVERNFGHHKSGAVFSFCKKNGINKYEPIQITGLIDAKLASIKEGEILNKYIDKGYIPINKAKCGSLGGLDVGLSLEKAKKVMPLCKNRKEFGKKYYSLYCYVLRNNKDLLDIYLPITKKAKDYTTEELIDLGHRYGTLKEFRKEHPSLCLELRKRGIVLFPPKIKKKKIKKPQYKQYNKQAHVTYKGKEYNGTVTECAKLIQSDFGLPSYNGMASQIYVALRTCGRKGRIYANFCQ